MSDSILFDPTMRIAQYALDGLASRQEVIGQNLANVDTPGYRAQQVDFESTLQRAMSGADQIPLENTHQAHLPVGGTSEAAMMIVKERAGGALRADGNSVDIDVELSQMAETGIRYQAVSQSLSKKLILLKSLATGR